jgi:hypothetical protein
MLPLLFPPLASAQRADAPTFGLQAPSSCTGAQPGYTCTGSAQITSYSPTTCGEGCHVEYCFSRTVSGTYAVCNEWYESVPASISLGSSLDDGTYTIYSEYCTLGTTTPFGSFWATVTDTDTSGPNGTSETAGPNGCTYEPMSNNGVVIVRYLIDSSSPTIQTYSIVNTGLVP